MNVAYTANEDYHFTWRLNHLLYLFN